MSNIQVDTFSQSLKKLVTFSVTLPDDLPEEMKKDNVYYQRPMKTIFLLHGYTGMYKDWGLGCNLQDLSARYNIATVCPSGDNSFYLDQEGVGFAYGEFIGCELPQIVQRMFGLSCKREDNLIAGLSMGGFGALRNGLKYHNHFSKIIALSSALIIHNIENIEEGFVDHAADYGYYRRVFGELKKLEHSENNPEYLVKQLVEGKEEIPDIYMACGTEDFLLKENRAFAAYLKHLDVDFTYIEDAGEHNWEFWKPFIVKGLEWALC